MSKQETMIVTLKSMMLDHAVVAELKRYSVNDEDDAKKFILSVNRALYQHARQVFHDWGYVDPVGISLLLTSALVVGINTCFPLDQNDWAAHTVNRVMMWITAALVAGCGINLHGFHRDLMREKITAIQGHCLDFYASTQMTLWHGLQAQKDIVHSLEAWEFNPKIVALLKDDWMDITWKPRRNEAKKASFLKRIRAHRGEFEFYMRTVGQGVSRILYLPAGLMFLGGAVFINQMSWRGCTPDNLIFMGVFAFFYKIVRRRAWESGGSYALAEWDIQEIGRLVAVLSPENREREEKHSNRPAVIVTAGQSKSALSRRHSGGRVLTKKRIAKTKTYTATCTTKLKRTLFRLCSAATSLSVWGYQLMTGVFHSSAQRITVQLTAKRAFQESGVAEKISVQPRVAVRKRSAKALTRRKTKKIKEAKEIKSVAETAPLSPPSALSVSCEHESVIEKIVSDTGGELASTEGTVSAAPVLPDEEEKSPAPVMPLEQNLQTPDEIAEPLPVFSPVEEKETLVERIQCAEEAARLHYSCAVGAGEQIRNLQAQLAQATHVAHYWQWQAVSLWQRLASPPVQQEGLPLENGAPLAPTGV